MPKTISLETSKRLNELGLLDDIETECFFVNKYNRLTKTNGKSNEFFIKHKITVTKALTLDELFEFMGKGTCHISFIYPNGGKWNLGFEMFNLSISEDTIIECLENFLIYLLDNKLIGQQLKT